MLPAVIAVLAGLAAGLAAGRRPRPTVGGKWAAGNSAAGKWAAKEWAAGKWSAQGWAAREWAVRPVGALAAGAGAGAAAALAGRAIPGDVGLAVLTGGYAVLAATALAARRHPGMVLVAAGLLANLVVVAADGGMPVRDLPPGAVAAGHHHGLTSGDHLTGLADDARVPALAVTLSAGDVVSCLGAAVAAFAWLEPTAAARRRPSRAAPGGGALDPDLPDPGAPGRDMPGRAA